MYVPILKFIDVLVFFEILLHKLQNSWPPLLGNRHCYGNHFAPHSLGCRSHVGFLEWSLCDHP